MMYIDNARISYRGMRMSHLMADTTDELLWAERALGLPPNSIQYPGTEREHLDVSASKRVLAIRLGAQTVTSRELVNIVRKRRSNRPEP